MTLLDVLVFQIYPYIALAVFAVGSWMRFDHDAYTWRTGSSQLLSGGWSLRLGSNLFHVGVIAILLGHFVGLLTPHWAYEWIIDAGTKQRLAVIAGGTAGVFCFVGLSLLLHRRLFDPRIRRTSTMIDIVILALLWVQLVLGMITLPYSISHSDGGTMLALSAWAQSIVTFQAGAADMVRGLALPFQMHLVLGMSLFLVTPFSRLVHIFSAPVWYLFRSWQIVRVRGGATRRPGPVQRPGVVK